MQLADLTPAQAQDIAVVLVPVGSLEQHGPHLPLDTDTTIAVAVARGATEQLVADGHTEVVALEVAYGSSGEHQSFAGTSSIGSTVLQHLVVELVRSLRTWATRVVLVNAHGGNAQPLQRAVDQLVAEGHDVAWVACATETVDLHAGRTETSLMLHLRPSSVRLELAEPGCTDPLETILPVMLSEGVAAVSANGVLGDPSGASAAEGDRVLRSMIEDVLTQVTST